MYLTVLISIFTNFNEGPFHTELTFALSQVKYCFDNYIVNVWMGGREEAREPNYPIHRHLCFFTGNAHNENLSLTPIVTLMEINSA